MELNLSTQDFLDTFYLYFKYILSWFDIRGVELRSKPAAIISDTFEDK
jgi:hypothetical protein